MPCSAQVVAAKCCKTVQFCANILWLRDSNTAWPKYCTQMLSHRRMLIYRDAFIQGCFYTEKLFTQTCFDTDVYTYRCFIRRCFYAQLPWCTDAFTQGCFYTKELLHTDTRVLLHTDAFTQQCFYTQEFLHTCVFTQEIFRHRVSFTQRKNCTNTLTRFFLNANTFIQRRFWNTDNTQILSQKSVLHGYLYTEMLLHTGAFRTRTRLGRGTVAWVRLDTRFTGGFKPFWTQAAIQSRLYVYMQIRFLQGDAFVHKCSYTAMGLRTEMV